MYTRYQVFALAEPNSHPPLGLASVLSYLRTFLEATSQSKIILPQRIDHSVLGVKHSLKRHHTPVLLFSHYTWNDTYNRNLCRALKKSFSKSISIHGGPSVPKRKAAIEEFFSDCPAADILVHGEGESTLLQILLALADHRGTDLSNTFLPHALNSIGSLSTRHTPWDGTHKAPQPDLASLPPPSLDNILQDKYWLASIIETNRGCPYSCSFCDWGSLTQQKIRQFSFTRIKTEIDWATKRRIEVMYIADANFGILPRDVEIAQYIAAKKTETGYPRKIYVNYAKNATSRVVQIEKIFQDIGISGGVVALQTTDPETLATVQRANIRTDKMTQLISEFRDLRIPVTTDLLLGLPGGNYQSFLRDLQWCFDNFVRANVFCLQILPNSDLGDPETMQRLGIKVDKNNTVIETNSWSSHELEIAQLSFAIYHALVERSILKYILIYLQHEHSLFASELVDLVRVNMKSMPLIVRNTLKLFLRHTNIKRNIATYSPSMLAVDWKLLCQEFLAWICGVKNIHIEPDIANTLIMAQSSVLPSRRIKSRTIRLQHDFVTYVQGLSKHRIVNVPKLATFPPGDLVISPSTADIIRLPLRFALPYGTHLVAFEIRSNLQETMVFDRILFSREGVLKSMLSMTGNLVKLANIRLQQQIHWGILRIP